MELLDVAGRVIAALDHVGVPYSVGGSLASSLIGEPRASVDADILVSTTEVHVPAFLEALGDEFYADADALRRAVAARSSTNLIHQGSGIKVDLFVARTALDAHELNRRQRMTLGPGREWYVHSPEDILLVQRGRLDLLYLAATAAEIGVADLLRRAQREAGVAP